VLLVAATTVLAVVPGASVAAQAAAAGSVAHVAESGIDAGNDCSAAASPCATVSHALTQISSGATIWVSGTVQDRIQTGARELTIRGVPGSNAALDGEGGGRVILAQGPLRLEDLTIRNGSAMGDVGGGVRSGFELTLRRVTVTGNEANGGGGIHVAGRAGLSVTDSVISNNSAFYRGGGLMSFDSPVTVTRSTIAGNTAGVGPRGGSGYSEGGGVHTVSTLLIRDSTLSGNAAETRGGAVMSENTTITGSTLSGNRGTVGSALFLREGALRLFSSTLTDNHGSHALYRIMGPSTLAGNIFADNSAGNCVTNSPWPEQMTSVGHNLADDDTCELTAVGDQPSTPIALGALADNGGGIRTHLPAADGPAANRIPVETVVDGQQLCTREDQRGILGPVPDANGCAVGAVEPSGFALREQDPFFLASAGGTLVSGAALGTGGGSGEGDVTFTTQDATATGCRIAGVATVLADTPGTCLVTARKAGFRAFAAASSPQISVTLSKAPQPELVLTAAAGPVTDALPLEVAGGGGSGALTFAVTDGTATRCRVTGAEVRADTVGTCRVTAHKAPDAVYLAANSGPVTFSFAHAVQAALTVDQSAMAVDQRLALTTSGGSGAGAVSFTARRVSDALSADPAGCRIEDTRVLVADLPGQCVVRATKASDGVYGTVASGETTISVDKAEQAPLKMTFKPGAVEVEVRVTGGSGTGVVWVETLDRSARGCTVSDRDGGFWLRADTRGTCDVMAFKEADTRYGLGWSPLTSVELPKLVPTPVRRPGSVGALKVKGPAQAKKRRVTWARPTSGGPATRYRVSISKGARQLVSVSVIRPKLVVKRSALVRGRLKVTVTAYNAAGGSAPASRKFSVR